MGTEICKNHEHPCHRKHLQRLNRISGQIEGIKKMIEEGRYCPDILTQTHAARAALKNLEIEILDTHLSNCVSEAFETKSETLKKEKIDEIKIIMQRFI